MTLELQLMFRIATLNVTLTAIQNFWSFLKRMECQHVLKHEVELAYRSSSLQMD